MKRVTQLHNLEDTRKLADQIAATLKGGEVLGLVGPLGAGKTTFTQALARALGVKRNVRSPSFTVMQLYQLPPVKSKRSTVNRRRLCHVDAYRLAEASELEALGLNDHLTDKKTITVIEWADKIKTALPPHTVWFMFTMDGSKRVIAYGG